MTCNGGAGDKLYLKTQKRWMKVKGNFCTFRYKDDDDNEVWKCQYIKAEINAVLPGTDQLDMNIMCETERDANVAMGCRSTMGPTYESYCQTNGKMGHCPSSHCTQ